MKHKTKKLKVPPPIQLYFEPEETIKIYRWNILQNLISLCILILFIILAYLTITIQPAIIFFPLAVLFIFFSAMYIPDHIYEVKAKRIK